MTSLIFLSLLGKPMPERIQAFRQEPKISYQKLIETAFDEQKPLQIRWRSLTTMGLLDARYFQKHLEKALVSKEWFVRNAALIAVLNAPRDEAVKWSIHLLGDPSLMVRTQAVRNLVGLEAREAESSLWRQIWNKSNFRGKESLWVRAHIAEALGRLAHPGNPQPFLRLILDPDERLHKWAILGLEKTTGYKLSHSQEPVEVQRQKWLARLGADTI